MPGRDRPPMLRVALLGGWRASADEFELSESGGESGPRAGGLVGAGVDVEGEEVVGTLARRELKPSERTKGEVETVSTMR